MKKTMEVWKAFLDSLDTPGGHVFLLMLIVCGMLAAIVGASAPTIITQHFELFAGALLLALRGNKTNGNK